jgi:hypothetical protein
VSAPRRSSRPGSAGWTLALALAVIQPAPAGAGERPAAPLHLAETGLYSDPASHAVDPRNLHYAPQYPLWSDGARKSRWVFLPPGKTIDASDPDAWVFPVGTKVWKEFAFGRRVETRYLEKVSDGAWTIATYVWNEAETDAVRAPEEGIRNHAEIAGGKRHDIPGVADCRSCHEGRQIQVLGFSALQLSPDRDPGAAHAEPFTPDMVDLTTLVERRLVASHSVDWIAQPPRIAARSPTERSALGYLHANCGNCHDRSTSLASIGMLLRQSATGDGSPDPVGRTAVRQASQFQLPGEASGEAYRVDPGNPARSTVVFRMATRNPMRQMPPLGTKVVDQEGVDLIRSWIAGMDGDVRLTLHEQEKAFPQEKEKP